MQLLLFDDHVNFETANKRLQLYVDNGLKFLTIPEVSSIIGLTSSQVRNAIYLCRLDAILIGGVYRIPWFSVIEYIRQKYEISKQFFAYKRYIEEHEIKGVVKYHLLLSKGISKKKAKEMLKAKNRYISDEVIQDIDNFKFEELKEDLKEEDMIDWYDLKRLNLPYRISTTYLANLLRIPLKFLIADSDIDINYFILEWPEVYDLLISKEIVNLPADYRENIKNLYEETEEDDYKQLELF
ncbi:MAG: hypothetical protein ACPKNR_14535 [Pleomorphochaeta sp.]